MNRRLREALEAGFGIPAPTRTQAFCRTLPQPSISTLEFLGIQASFIRKRVWGLSGVLFALAWVGAGWLERDVLWCISACMPLLALAALTESGRSERFGMDELELATRFSLKSVVLARLCVLGAANLALLGALLPFVQRHSGVSALQTGACMACPYLLTASGGLWAARRVPGREAGYLCAGIAAAVSVGHLLLYQSFPGIYAARSLPGWLAAFALLAAGTTKQCYQTIRKTEELAWNL